jgi:hypothetical protein
MNAPNSVSEDKRAAEHKAYEPSMEEILASIRRIIADDQVVTSRRPPAPKVPAEAQAVEPSPAPPGAKGWAPIPPLRGEAVARAMASASIEAEKTREPVARQHLTSAAEPKTQPPQPPRPRQTEAVQIEERAATGLENLAKLADAGRAHKAVDRQRMPPLPRPESLSEDPLISPATDVAVSAAFNALVASRFLQSSEVLGETVRDMIRPMLKAWLDDNLPILVERLVRAEIERVARGGR